MSERIIENHGVILRMGYLPTSHAQSNELGGDGFNLDQLIETVEIKSVCA